MNWQPIETAPKDGTRILASCNFAGRKNVRIAWFGHDWHEQEGDPPLWLSGDGDGFSVGYYFTPCHPTHWMPLPESPEEAQ